MKSRVERLSLADITQRLSEYEQKYDMTSKEFRSKYESGALGDDRQWILWMGLCRMLSAVEAHAPK